MLEFEVQSCQGTDIASKYETTHAFIIYNFSQDYTVKWDLHFWSKKECQNFLQAQVH